MTLIPLPAPLAPGGRVPPIHSRTQTTHVDTVKPNEARTPALTSFSSPTPLSLPFLSFLDRHLHDSLAAVAETLPKRA